MRAAGRVAASVRVGAPTRRRDDIELSGEAIREEGVHVAEFVEIGHQRLKEAAIVRLSAHRGREQQEREEAVDRRALHGGGRELQC